jgi:hypothetical protein
VFVLYIIHNIDMVSGKSASKLSKEDWHIQRDSLERYGKEYFGVKELDDWYSVKSKMYGITPK